MHGGQRNVLNAFNLVDDECRRIGKYLRDLALFQVKNRQGGLRNVCFPHVFNFRIGGFYFRSGEVVRFLLQFCEVLSRNRPRSQLVGFFFHRRLRLRTLGFLSVRRTRFLCCRAVQPAKVTDVEHPLKQQVARVAHVTFPGFRLPTGAVWQPTVLLVIVFDFAVGNFRRIFLDSLAAFLGENLKSGDLHLRVEAWPLIQSHFMRLFGQHQSQNVTAGELLFCGGRHVGLHCIRNLLEFGARDNRLAIGGRRAAASGFLAQALYGHNWRVR